MEDSTTEAAGYTPLQLSAQITPTGSCHGDIVTAPAQLLAAEVKELQQKLESVQAAVQKNEEYEREKKELTSKLLEYSTKRNKELEKNASLQEELLANQELVMRLTEEAQQQKACISKFEHKMEVQEFHMKAREAKFKQMEMEKNLQIDELSKKLVSQQILLTTLAKRCGIVLS